MRMQCLLLFIVFLSLTHTGRSQNVGIGTAAPDSSAELDIVATKKGLLIPRTQVANITSPALGLAIFDTDSGCYVVYDGTVWKNLCRGDAGTNPEQLLSKKVRLTPAQIVLMDSLPVEIIPAPGPDYAIVVIAAQERISYGTTPYAATSLVSSYSCYPELMYGGGDSPLFLGSAVTFFQSTQDAMEEMSKLKCTVRPNQPIVASIFQGYVSGGDSPIDIYVTYKIIRL